MHRAHRIRLNPTSEQAQYFWRCAGVARFTFNWALAEYNAALARDEKPNVLALQKEFNRRRREEGLAPWVGEVQSRANQYAFRDLKAAVSRYHDLRKAGKLTPPKGFKPRKDGKPFGWPRFKARDKTTPAFGLRNADGFRCEGHNAFISRCPGGPVNMAEELRFDGHILNCRVSHTGGHWYLSVSVELPDPEPVSEPKPGIVGVDLGLTHLLVTSDGTVYKNPKRLQAGQRKLARLQRKMARQEKGGKNWEKTKRQVGRLHERIANQRREGLHEITTELVESYGTVVVEDLNVKGMQKNHSRAKAVADASFGEIRRQLEYKAPAKGGRVVVVSRWFPSSKTCHDCGTYFDVPDGQRMWTCPTCGTKHDRDLNAALNIRDYRPAEA